MPELPEVETVVRMLRARALGWRIASVARLRADIVRPACADLAGRLVGRTIRSIGRRGKRIALGLDDGQTLCIHLGMSGQLTVAGVDQAMQGHTHLVLIVERDGDKRTARATLRFRDPRRFGGVWMLGCGEPSDAGLGPEPLEMPPAELARRLGRTRRAIKAALLDQSLVAGLGNIYVDESLFRAGIDPRTPANRLSRAQVGQLSRAIKQTLRQAIRHRGSTLRDYVDVNGESGRYQDLHQVYGRGGQPCRACGAAIQRIVLGGRSTHFCPTCQS